MYCSSCGGAIARGLEYCNHCGARLSERKDEALAKRAELFPESLIWAIVAAFTVGLGAIIGLLAVMKEVVQLNTAWIIAFTLLSFVLVFAVEGVLITQLLHHRKGDLETGNTTGPREQSTKELDAAQPRALPEPVPSITEHTTRAFEPLYTERKSN